MLQIPIEIIALVIVQNTLTLDDKVIAKCSCYKKSCKVVKIVELHRIIIFTQNKIDYNNHVLPTFTTLKLLKKLYILMTKPLNKSAFSHCLFSF